MSGLTYKDSGVDIDLGDKASEIMYNASKETWQNRKGKIGEVHIPFEHFSGLRVMEIGGLPQYLIQSKNYDSIGTKVEISQRLGKHDTIAYDLLAMLCDDAVRMGMEPIWVGSVLEVNSLGRGPEDNHLNYIQQLADGMKVAAKDANIAIINGEIAEVGNMIGGYGDFNYTWGGSVTGIGSKAKILTGKEIEPGDHLVALKEDGPRSNGLSLIRKSVKLGYGDEWHKENYKGKNIGEMALQPSRIYSGAVMNMLGAYDEEPLADITGIAHITGGGIPGKLGRTLKPSGYGAEIHDPFEPCDLMLHCQHLGNIADEEAYKTWNMGNGMIIATTEPSNVIDIAKEHSIKAKVIGEVELEPSIQIKSKGLYRNDEFLSF